MNGLPRYVLFDLDGTILDSLPGIESSVRAAFAACGLPVPETSLRQLIGPPIRTILSRAGGVTDERTLNALEHAFREDYDTAGWQKTICFPGAEDVLQRFRQAGRRIFVVSNKPRHISLRILHKEHLLDLFEDVVTRDSRDPAYGEKAEMIAILVKQLGITPSECVFVGDTMEDAKAAAITGIGFVFMRHGYGSIDTSAMPVACELDNLSQLSSLLSEELVRD